MTSVDITFKKAVTALLAGVFVILLPASIPAQRFKDLSKEAQDSLIPGLDPEDRCGFACVTGNIDGDLFDDLIFSAPKSNGFNNEYLQTGEIYILRGQSDRFHDEIDLSVDPDIILYSTELIDSIGISLATGDLNGDLIEDLIIGVPFGDGPNDEIEDAGEIYVVYGGQLLPSRIFLPEAADVILYGAVPGDRAGNKINTGDLDHDGIEDLFVSAPLANGPLEMREDSGSIYVIFGKTDLPRTIHLAAGSDIVIYGDDPADRLGSDVQIADIDGSGFNDLVMGVPSGDGLFNIRPEAGEVAVLYDLLHYTGVIDLRQSVDTLFYGRSEDDGAASICLTDINGDGTADLIIGAPNAEPETGGLVEPGAVYIFFGGEAFPALVDLGAGSDVVFYGREKRDNFGGNLASGDFNGDGIYDLAIRARLADHYPTESRENCGSVSVLYGRRNFPGELLQDRDAATVIFGEKGNDELGTAMAAGSLNGDPFDELVVSSRFAGSENQRIGKVYLFYGGNEPLILTGPGPGSGQDSPAQVRIFGAYPDMGLASEFQAYPTDSYGTNTAAGDINGDGVSEIVTGVGPGPDYPPNVRIWLFNGQKIIGFMAYGVNRFGVNVAAGDINGDGKDEIITGPGPGAVFGPHVRNWIFSPEEGLFSPEGDFFAYGTRKFGVNVSSGDVDGDGSREILTAPGPGMVFGPHVRAWKFAPAGSTPMQDISFFAYGSRHFGCRVAAGNVDGDAYDEIITAPGPGPVFGPHIRAWDFDNLAVQQMKGINFFAYATTLKYGAKISGGDIDGDGFDEIVTGPGPGPVYATHIRGWNFDGQSLAPMAEINFIAFGSPVKFGVNPAIGAFGF